MENLSTLLVEIPSPRRDWLVPYTTLFRSSMRVAAVAAAVMAVFTVAQAQDQPAAPPPSWQQGKPPALNHGAHNSVEHMFELQSESNLAVGQLNGKNDLQVDESASDIREVL